MGNKYGDIRWNWLKERGINVFNDPYQLDYMNSLWKHPDMVTAVFGIGRAGTGKTVLATLAGVYELEKGNYKKIRYVRNAVPIRREGFLPGDTQQKGDPFMQPFKDALDLVQPGYYEYLLERGLVEAVTTSYIQGSTWDEEFIIFDEVQNWELTELQAGLTRVGKKSKIVLTGSDRQVVNPKVKRIAGLLPYEIYMEHFKGNPRIIFHELVNVHRGWFAELADEIDQTIERLMNQ